jgi:hippurate hydrolase
MPIQWQDIVTDAISLRRELHKNPELGWQETRTAERIRTILSSLDIPWRRCADTGTVAWLNQHGKGRHIALRGDIDALPITEKTDLDWASGTAGCMHACGHDGHTAALIASARWLKAHEGQLPGPVTLIFQPAEEGGHGAREMIHDGALDSVDEIYGWHNWPAIPFGKLVSPDDIVMCGNGTFSITVNGEGGHASQPELCRDPVLAASAITMALQQVISRRLPPQSATVLSVTSIEAPSGATIIPSQAKLGGSIRISNEASREQVNRLIREIATQTATSYGVSCLVDIQSRYQATINHPAPAQRLRKLWQSLHGTSALHDGIALPIMASEDFSYYLREIPGAFALIGADDGRGHDKPCHSDQYDFNDRLIPMVTQLFAGLAGLPSRTDN